MNMSAKLSLTSFKNGRERSCGLFGGSGCDGNVVEEGAGDGCGAGASDGSDEIVTLLLEGNEN